MKCCLAIASLMLCLCVSIIKCKGRYEIYIDLFEYPFGKRDQLIDYGTLRPRKFNHTAFVIDGEIELLQPLDDDYSIVLSMFNKQAGQFKKLGDIKVEKLCSFFKKDATFYTNLQQHSTLPKQKDIKCPAIPPGKYRAINYIIEENGYLPDYIPGSENWRSNVEIKKKDVVVGGLTVHTVIKRKNPTAFGLLNSGK